MKSFFKYLLATIIGMLIVGLIMFFICIGSLGAMIAGSSKPPVQVKDNSVLEIKLDRAIPDKATSAFDNLSLFNSGKPTKSIGLSDYVKAIREAKSDNRIKGIYIRYAGAPLGFATAQELRSALSDFKESGKFIYAYADAYTSQAYHLASVSDSLFLQPQGTVMFQGLGVKIMFFTNFMEKVGVEMQVFRHGQFKSAVEPFFRTDMSEANRRQYQVLFGSMWNSILADISESRHLSADRLNTVADSLLGYSASSSVKAGLVDALVPSSYMKEKLIASRLGVSDTMEINSISLSDYFASLALPHKVKDKVAVVYAEGEIAMSENSKSGQIGADLADQIEKALKDRNVKALVLRVNSPGGSVLTADIIYQAMMKAKGRMPVVASYGNYAASGGYYISCMADRIFALPNTLTGSIGVFGTVPNVEELATDKLGFTFDFVQTNRNALAFQDVFRPLTSYESAVLQASIEEIYDGFISKVAEGRKMTKAYVDSIGQGRVWSGTNAISIGLVDELGGLEDAVAYAAEKAGLSQYKVEVYPKEKDFMTQVMELFGEMETARAEACIGRHFGQAGLELYRNMTDVMSFDKPAVWARMPEIFVCE